MNYLNDPHYDVDEAQLDHFDQGVAKRKTQRYCCDKCRRKGEYSPIKQERGFAHFWVRNLFPIPL